MSSDDFDTSVFINCPFDDAYRPNFRAAVFTVLACGFTPRCALEIVDAGEVRIDIISRIIGACRLGIHDISRTDLDPVNALPRFNMPLELGIFLGCKRFGDERQRSKSCIVFDTERYRYQKFLSDISGQDIFEHKNDYRLLISKIRDWLATQVKGKPLAGGKSLATAYDILSKDLPAICAKLKLDEDALTFTDLVYVLRASVAG